MRKDLLLLLADYLDKLKEPIDMTLWEYDTDCGTAGCAMWHACQVPQLKDAGLFMKYGYPTFDDGHYTCSGIAAARVVFGIDDPTARHLFLADSYDGYDSTNVPPKVVADRIRKLAS